MPLSDSHGMAVSGASRAAVDAYDRALLLLNGFRADPLAEIDAALAHDPRFVMGHAMRAGLFVISTERALVPELARSVAAGEALADRANERERAHFAAARAWLEGDFHLAGDRYGAIAATWPRDLFALQVAHQCDFFLGRQAALRDRPTAALAAWGQDEKPRGYILGMQAFGLEENGAYAAAEDAGRAAVAIDPTDAWATHAVAHVLEMQGRSEAGIGFLEGQASEWTAGTLLQVHNWWHLALYCLEQGDIPAVLALYDRHIRPAQAAPAIELVDASAMLWRLRLCDIDVAGRWAELAAAWRRADAEGYYAFNDVHALMAYLGAGDGGAVERVLAGLAQAAAGPGSNAMMAGMVGLPVARALVAFDRGQWGTAAETLAPLLGIAQRFGGSHAQRDLLALTLLEAALRGGQHSLAGALAAARVEAKPASPLARHFAGRVEALRRAA
jgi:hypothetical protein